VCYTNWIRIYGNKIDVKPITVDILNDILILLSLPSNIEDHKAHYCAIEKVISMLPNTDLLIIGDYNLPNIWWYNKMDDSLEYRTRCHCNKTQYADILSILMNLTYFSIIISNVYGNVLDLCSLLNASWCSQRMIHFYPAICFIQRLFFHYRFSQHSHCET